MDIYKHLDIQMFIYKHIQVCVHLYIHIYKYPNIYIIKSLSITYVYQFDIHIFVISLSSSFIRLIGTETHSRPTERPLLRHHPLTNINRYYD